MRGGDKFRQGVVLLVWELTEADHYFPSPSQPRSRPLAYADSTDHLVSPAHWPTVCVDGTCRKHYTVSTCKANPLCVYSFEAETCLKKNGVCPPSPSLPPFSRVFARPASSTLIAIAVGLCMARCGHSPSHSLPPRPHTHHIKSLARHPRCSLAFHHTVNRGSPLRCLLRSAEVPHRQM